MEEWIIKLLGGQEATEEDGAIELDNPDGGMVDMKSEMVVTVQENEDDVADKLQIPTDVVDKSECYKFICDLCSSRWRTNYNLQRHVKQVHTGYSFMCSFCEKKCKTKSNLTDHESIHRNNISTKCSICCFVMRSSKKCINSHM